MWRTGKKIEKTGSKIICGASKHPNGYKIVDDFDDDGGDDDIIYIDVIILNLNINTVAWSDETIFFLNQNSFLHLIIYIYPT